MTEALKIWLDEHKKAYCSNTLAGYVAVVLSVAVGGAYTIMMEVAMNEKNGSVLNRAYVAVLAVCNDWI